MRKMRSELVDDRGSEYPAEGPGVGICVNLLAQACSPDADVAALWARSVLLGALTDRGLLTSWQRGTKLDDAVFGVAATVPIPGFDQFDPDAFIQHLKSRRESSG